MSKTVALALLAVLLFGAASFEAPAQTYPAKPIRFVLPYPAGGSADALLYVCNSTQGISARHASKREIASAS